MFFGTAIDGCSHPPIIVSGSTTSDILIRSLRFL